MTRIFISHSHSDEAIADLLIDFLGEAMEISKKDIRCTSDPNHGLDFSPSSISEQLKKDLKNAEALIVIATIDSLRSPWILFEVGSFWTTDKLVAPIIGPGLTFNDLPGPLKGYRSIQIKDEDVFYELGELINQLTAKLKVKQIGASRRKDNKLRAFIKDFSAWESQIAQSQEIEKLEARIQELEKELSASRSQLESQKLLHSQELQDQAREIKLRIQQLEQELSEARSQLAQVQESALSQKERFEKELEEKDREIIRLREQLVGLAQKNIESVNAQYFKEKLGDDIKLKMIAIPSGTFMMGSPEGEGRSNEKPQHKVTIQSFYMGKYPITQVQYQKIMGKNLSHFQGDDQRPVEMVSWEDAVEFCKKLSKQTGTEYILPTEAEWEYACRAGTTTKYYFGESITNEQVNYRGTVGKTTPVGKYPPNDFGLSDMHGNVSEWCADDWHKTYENAPIDGSAWLSRESNTKVRRGGSWGYFPSDCRSAYRLSYTRDDRIDRLGFRVVCVAPRTI